MQWNDSIFSGTHDEWSWAVSREMIRSLDQITVEHFPGSRLFITAFDSGPISPSDEERKAGWTTISGIMVSPPLKKDTSIPCDQFDEWYVFRELPNSFPSFDRFVNYGNFNLVAPNELVASFDPTWERSGLDWLIPLQEQFWQQIVTINPLAYIASGDNDIVVSRDTSFVQKFLKLATQHIAK